MITFIVEKAHISAMLRFGLTAPLQQHPPLSWYAEDPRKLSQDKAQLIHRQLTSEIQDEVGQMLLDENITAVSIRYPKVSIGDLPGRVDAQYLMPYHYTHSCRTPTPVEVLSLINCYEYQCCEDPDYCVSEAHRFCEALQSIAILFLPGYTDAPWEWTAEMDKSPAKAPS